MLLVIDNYDSFTFNLVKYFGELGAEVKVVRNDEIDVAGIGALAPSALVLSPGPCTPAKAGVCIAATLAFAGKLPILGVCLGHQAIGAAFGGKVVRAARLMHGKLDELAHDGRGVFAALPQRFPCQTLARFRPGSAFPRRSRSRRRQATVRSWAFAIALLRQRRRRLKACSSIPSRSSPSTATRF